MLKYLKVLLGGLLAMSSAPAAGDTPDFASATRSESGPAKTATGKSIDDIKKQVQSLWKEIVFEKDGKPVKYSAVIKTDAGDITLDFAPEVAPNHVRSFVALSKAGFYDGLTFHRCIEGFMIQGGCPLGTGTGGPGYKLKAEFNNLHHERGVLSAARSQDPNSAGCQFFICQKEAGFLDRQYTAYGKVSKGMDVVDKIVKSGDPGDNGRVDNPHKIEKITIFVDGNEWK